MSDCNLGLNWKTVNESKLQWEVVLWLWSQVNLCHANHGFVPGYLININYWIDQHVEFSLTFWKPDTTTFNGAVEHKLSLSMRNLMDVNIKSSPAFRSWSLIRNAHAPNGFSPEHYKMHRAKQWSWLDEFECRYAISSWHNLVWLCVVFHQLVLKYDISSTPRRGSMYPKARECANPVCIRQLEYCPHFSISNCQDCWGRYLKLKLNFFQWIEFSNYGPINLTNLYNLPRL
jgi:hypothetical protein